MSRDGGARVVPRAPRIVLSVTIRESLQFLRGFLGHLHSEGWEVHVVTNAEPLSPESGVTYHVIPMERDPSPWRDFRALAQWVQLVRRLRPDIVSSGTPKAGLLGMIAAWLCRVPVRVYMLRGLRLSTAQGVSRMVFSALERVAAACATSVLSVSHSLRDEFVSLGLAPSDKVVVLGHGSSNGVSIPESTALKVPGNPFTVGFMGRIHRDKGVDVLLKAMEAVWAQDSSVKLLLVGQEEPQGILDELLADAPMHWLGQIEAVGYTDSPHVYYQRMDALCLPTKREGFPNVVLEASAFSVPTIASRVTGCMDAVVDGETGILFTVDDSAALSRAILKVAADPTGAREMGRKARARVERDFRRDKVWELTRDYYRAELERTNGPDI